MAQTAGRNTVEIRDGKTLILPVKAKTVIYEGSMVAIDSNGYAISAKKAENLIAAGRAEEMVDAVADTTIRVRRGCFKWDNAASGAVTSSDILKPCYIADSETVTMTKTGTSVAGKVIAVDSDGVVVEMM